MNRPQITDNFIRTALLTAVISWLHGKYRHLSWVACVELSLTVVGQRACHTEGPSIQTVIDHNVIDPSHSC